MIGREVWKIGGSVLRHEEDYRRTAENIIGYLASNPLLSRLYVVVSAARGVTESIVADLAPGAGDRRMLLALLAGEAVDGESRRRFDTPRVAAELLRGELESALALRAGLASAGAPATLVTQWDAFPLVAGGSYLRAGLLPAESRRAFARFERFHRQDRLLLLTGFGAVNRAGRPVLLGSNASDYVAAVLTALDARVRSLVFVKDSGGLFEDFGAPGQTLVGAVARDRLRRMRFGRLLDRRVLDAVACDFRICGPDMAAGTEVAYASAGVACC
jgi:aspartokinase